MDDVLRIDPDAQDDRFARFRLIGWWDQQRIAEAKVLVIGAGALGNEIVKNLALLGFGRVVVCDLDRIEHSNLSRSVLYRPADIGRSKAQVAAERACEIYEGMRCRSLDVNIVYDLGLGLYRWADVILGGLDNREARVAINSAAAKTGKAWIDGAIERLDGVARVFEPATGPCYECTMSDVDWRMLEARQSCALLSRDEMEQGKVPTTPTTASIIAGIQVQEALKRLHDVASLSGQGYCFEGAHHQSYLVEYRRMADCPTHEAYEPIETLNWSVHQTTARDLLGHAQLDLGSQAVVESNHDLLRELVCGACGDTEQRLGSLGRTTASDARCPRCGEPRRPEIFHTIDIDHDFIDTPLGELGVPPWDIVTVRSGGEQRHYEFAGDRHEVLGPLNEAPQ
ncbi:HesA/MoeB/ThiF family protein [Botrimarina mediterranea]|uniref:HesA/MoeB/ThiF family protein n=1 Tax=Botrimarina mediterranea TaxID=2528022 RepID=UPI0011885EB3|nr:putative adenylyltransferase/sulfurtransferase MoeZ [Planctomycetes bacterium K2D]